MEIYQKIAKYIEERGIMQKFISDKTGIPQNVLSMTLNGKRTLTADEFIEIIKALGIDVNTFINDN